MSTPPNRRRPSTLPPPPPRATDEDDRAPDLEAIPGAEVDAADPSIRARAITATGPSWRERWNAIAPAMRRAASIASVVIVLAGSAIGGRAAHRWITTTPRFGAHDIQVTGNHRTSRDEILAASGVHEGVNVLGIELQRTEHAIERLPWVEHAHVMRRLPGTVTIEVEERSPAAIVSAGGLYLCTGDGTLFKRLQAGDPDDLPIVTGIAREDFDRDPDAAREYVRDALALLADVAASSLGTRARIEEVHRDATGDLSLVLADHDTYVWLGRGPYRAKLAHLSAVLAELDRQHLVAAEIHLESDRHPDRATVRLPVAATPPASTVSATAVVPGGAMSARVVPPTNPRAATSTNGRTATPSIEHRRAVDHAASEGAHASRVHVNGHHRSASHLHHGAGATR